MPDYQKLYQITYGAITHAERLIESTAAMLRIVQQQCEEIYIETDETPPDDEK